MAEHVYKKIELVGTSGTSIEEAVNSAVTKAGQTVHNLRWLEVAEIRAALDGGKVSQWQVTVRIGFTLDDHG